MEQKLRSFINSDNKKDEQSRPRKAIANKTNANRQSKSSDKSKKLLRGKSKSSNVLGLKHDRMSSEANSVPKKVFGFNSPEKNQRKFDRGSSITKSAPRKLSRLNSKSSLILSRDKDSSSRIYKSRLGPNFHGNHSGGSKSDTDEEEPVFYEIPTTKLSTNNLQIDKSPNHVNEKQKMK
jgi:hypothetical protein